MAIQMYSAMFSVRTELLRSIEIDLKSINCEGERGDDPFFFEITQISFIGFPPFFSSTLRYLTLFDPRDSRRAKFNAG